MTTQADLALPAPRQADSARRRVLVAPVTITPTKPLTLSHLKGLLWTDVLVRATAVRAEVTYRYSHTAYDPCEQTLGFWEYLDRTVGDRDYSGAGEAEIGELYMRYRAEPERTPFAACKPYLEAIDTHGWTHPASERLLELWTEQYRGFGLLDPGLTERQPPRAGLDEVIDQLARIDLCLDQRPHGGPVYLDVTSAGLPLRRIVGADGRPNYLACALRDLVPLVTEHDDVVLVHDTDLETDYMLLAKVLGRLGATVHRVSLGRVPIDGRVRSAREGGWRGHTAADLLARMSDRPADALALGARLYFVAMLGPGDQQSYRADLLERAVQRAERLLAFDTGTGTGTSTGFDADADTAGLLRPLEAAGREGHVDPYRLTCGLLRRGAAPVSSWLLREVYLCR